MTIANLQPVTEEELLAVRSVFERLAAGAPIVSAASLSTWRDDFETGSPDIVEISVAARRLKVSADTLKRWARRDPSLGGRVGQRWRVSLRRLRSHLRAKSGAA